MKLLSRSNLLAGGALALVLAAAPLTLAHAFSAGVSASAWKAIDGDGKPWTVTISSDDAGGSSNTHRVRIGVLSAG